MSPAVGGRFFITSTNWEAYLTDLVSLLNQPAREKNAEKVMAPHPSTLAWKIPRMGKPGELPSMGSHRVGHDGSYLAAAAAGKE